MSDINDSTYQGFEAVSCLLAGHLATATRIDALHAQEHLRRLKAYGQVSAPTSIAHHQNHPINDLVRLLRHAVLHVDPGRKSTCPQVGALLAAGVCLHHLVQLAAHSAALPHSSILRTRVAVKLHLQESRRSPCTGRSRAVRADLRQAGYNAPRLMDTG